MTVSLRIAARSAQEILMDTLRDKTAELNRMRADSWDAAHAAQAEFDPIFSALGDRAPAPLVGESPTGYRKRSLTDLKRFSPTWKDQDVRALPDAALEIAKRQIIDDARREAARPTALSLPADGRLVARIKPDAMGLPRVKEFYSTHAGACWDRFKRRDGGWVRAWNGKPVY